MDAQSIFLLQTALNALIWALLALWYVVPRLRQLPRARALAPLLFFHTSRSMGLVFLVPAVVGSRLPDSFAVPAAYGDLLAAALALVALLALRAGWRAAYALVWLFSLEGTVDLLNAIVQGLKVNIAGSVALGPAWFIPTLFVPALLVAHILIFWLLVRAQPTADAPAPITGDVMSPTAEPASQPLR